MVMSLVWQLFEPLLFGLVGSEVSVEYMNTNVFSEFSWEDIQTFLKCITPKFDLSNKLIKVRLPPLRKWQSCRFKH